MINEAALLLANHTSKFDLSSIRDASFAKQDNFVMDTNRMCAAQTTVRAGKTTGLAFKFFRAAHKYKSTMMPYIALTRDSAKNIMWPILQERAEQLKIDCNFTESDLTCEIKSTGSSIKLFGADMKNFIARLKGIKTPLAAVDEGQDFRSHLEELIDILLARTSEYEDGQVCLTGTPGPIPRGFFYDASQGLNGFSCHYWSLFENPYFPGAKKFVNDLIEKKKWPMDNPTLLREYFGKWVQDLEALVFRYNDSINHFDHMPDLTDYVIGLDFGTDDADAISVIGWHKHKKECYLVEEYVQNGLSVSEIVNEVQKRYKEYNPLKIVADTGANGKKIALEISKRLDVPVHAADKQRKIEHISWLNDAMRTRKFFAKKDSRFAQDCAVVEWDYDKSTSDKLVIKDDPHSDICDAVLYSYIEALAWLSEPAKPIKNLKEQWSQFSRNMADEAIENSIRAQQEKELEDNFFATAGLDPEETIKYFVNKKRGA